MPVTDALLYVHGTGTAAGGAITNTSGVIGDALCWAGTNGTSGSVYSNLELDFGPPNAGSTSPYLVQFPSSYEKLYSFPPEVVGDGGVEWGLHMVVCQTFNSATSIQVEICTSAATAALYTTSPPNPIAARTFSLSQLQVAGAHYFIPVNQAAVQEFLRTYNALTGGTPTQGTVIQWFGPKTGGEQ